MHHCRFAKTKDFPLKLRFTDCKNTTHDIYLFDRIDSDAQTKFMRLQLSFQPSSFFNSHEITSKSYRAKNIDEYKVASEKRDKGVELL